MTWRPTRRRTPVFSDLHLHIPAGQRVLLTGPSGAGKSTLLRALGGLLRTASDGDLTGRVLLDGEPVERASNRPALLFQDPLAGIVAQTVGRDVAFGLENAGRRPDEIWPAVHQVLADTGFPYPPDHPTSALAGGEAQRLALAGSLATGSRLLLLDEPTSMLDPASAATIRSAVRRYATAQRPTVVLVEHRLDSWLDFCDRLIVLGADGQLVADGDPSFVLGGYAEELARGGVWVPGAPEPSLLDVDPDLVGPWSPVSGELVRAEAVSLRFGRRTGNDRPAPPALAGVDAVLVAGRALAVTGTSGAGKSTLVSVLAGLQRPTDGRVLASRELAPPRSREPWRWRSRELAARLAWVPQTPEHGIVSSTVGDEVRAAARACGRTGVHLERRAEGLLDLLGLSTAAERSPYQLSGGEQRRLMVAAALAGGPAGALLDEPTVGQDRLTWGAVLGAVAAARSVGVGVALATHDRLAVDVLADDVLTLDHGAVVR